MINALNIHEIDFELSQKRTVRRAMSVILLNYFRDGEIEIFTRGKSILEPIYKFLITSFYLKEYSQYRHMWE